MTTASPTISVPSAKKANIYLYHPLVDIFFVCGGWLLLLVSINFALRGNLVSGEVLTPWTRTFVVMGLYLISQPHSAATIFKLYGSRELAKKHTLVAVALPPLLAAALLAAIYIPWLARLEATAYVALALHHVMAQCYGIAVMYCARAQMQLTSVERRLLQTTLWTAVAAAVLQQLSTDYTRHSILGVQLFQFDFISPALVIFLQLMTLAAVLSLTVLQIERRHSGRPVMPLAAALTMLTASALLTIWNSQTELVWLFVPPFFHGSQYLCVVMSYFVKEAKSGNQAMTAKQVGEFIAVRMTELFIVGLILFVGIPKLISLAGTPFALCSALMFFAINLHHFAADSCIWKMRDNRLRRHLV